MFGLWRDLRDLVVAIRAMTRELARATKEHI